MQILGLPFVHDWEENELNEGSSKSEIHKQMRNAIPITGLGAKRRENRANCEETKENWSLSSQLSTFHRFSLITLPRKEYMFRFEKGEPERAKGARQTEFPV